MGKVLSLVIDVKPPAYTTGLGAQLFQQFQQQQQQQHVPPRMISDLCEPCAKSILEPYPREAVPR